MQDNKQCKMLILLLGQVIRMVAALYTVSEGRIQMIKENNATLIFES